MDMEFEGKTEKEAIDKAIEALGLERDEFDVEILENNKPGLFHKGNVKIRVHINAQNEEQEETAEPESSLDEDVVAENAVELESSSEPLEPVSVFEDKILDFVEDLIGKMDYPGTAYICYRNENKIRIMIESEHSGILIGKKGKNLDAIQLLVNVYAGKLKEEPPRIIIDVEKYRERRESNLVKLALRTAEQVRRTKRSKLLEPMNPFERRIIHTALNDMEDIATKSDGEGLLKQVRVIYRPVE
ncbi:MAG: protein jag [Spirochaetia bacterium]|nr:protein jag [Spirochaetia bacterium]MBR4436848.1 protein jag [Spirochaetales bacterium]MBR4797560.1 protein jag [Spirochaetia bacterium]MBR5016869.1 protein jag [Spirochaetia bacterium]MBR5915875.1 protein jag [Spirochaetia bacterium]